MQRFRRQTEFSTSISVRITHLCSVQPPSIIALFCQIFSAILSSLLAIAIVTILDVEATLITWVILQSVVSGFIVYGLGLSLQWIFISFAFVPSLAIGLSFQFGPHWYLLLFLILCLTYWNTFRTQVPLYLSSEKVKRAVHSLLPHQREFSLIDLGCGIGSLLNYLGKTRPDGKYYGVEIAPLPFAISFVRNLLSGRKSTITHHNFWRLDLSGYDVVYAYLSPVPMPALWEKVSKEMHRGAVFVSNSFEVPGVKPDYTIKVGDTTRSVLYVWNMPGSTAA